MRSYTNPIMHPKEKKHSATSPWLLNLSKIVTKRLLCMINIFSSIYNHITGELKNYPTVFEMWNRLKIVFNVTSAVKLYTLMVKFETI